MADRVYSSSKPSPHPPNNGGATAFPPTKSQNNGATRVSYRPHPTKPARRSRRGLCSCCLWLIMLLAILVILAAIAGGIFYLIYRPHRPAFSVSAIRLAALNVTSSGHLTSLLDLNVTVRNPNKKLVYLYDPVSVTVLSGGVNVGNGTFPTFVQDAGSATYLSAAASSSGQPPPASELRKSSSLPVEVDMETKAGVKVGGLKTKKIGINVRCEGLRAAVPKGKKPAAASPGVDCNVKLRVKIWKWTL